MTYNRWLVPPAALAIHLSIGQAYAFSVFNLPLTKLIGITAPAAGDWTLPQVVAIFSVAIVFLGLSAAFTGRWLEDAGPRKAMVIAACCFGGGLMMSSAGAASHFLPLIYLGYGVVGGTGLGIGYISPVSTLIKWFPDRPGVATGLAIMGFGGGAMIGSPLAVLLMAHFKSPFSTGVAPTFLAMGVIYLAAMLAGAFFVRVPDAAWKPAGFHARSTTNHTAHGAGVPVEAAFRTPRFWLLWMVLFLNVSAGIGILSVASNMIQEMFSPRVSAAAAAGFVGLLSLFNMFGRIFWASLSDFLGRRPTYTIVFTLGAALYALLPILGRSGNLIVFVLAAGVILTMYGGGFATIPAYLRDEFGTMHVGAIHGRLLTAWSAAGLFGPFIITKLHPKAAAGVMNADTYVLPMNVMAGLLVLGLICNLLMTRFGKQRELHDAVGV